jgi:hypothetical protein
VLLPDVEMQLLMVWDDAEAGRLRADKGKGKEAQQDGRAGWVPSRRNVFRFLRGCWGVVGLERALELFGGVVGEEYLRAQYAWGFSGKR